MDKQERERLEAAGWKIGSADDFLGLTPAESAIVEMKLALAENLRRTRLEKNITQKDLAKLMGSSQSRIAKLESADRSVSMEILVKSLVTLGVSPAQIGEVLCGVN